MKIGIITFHRADSYGAVLQAYALCKAVTETGSSCDILDYHNDVIADTVRNKRILESEGAFDLVKNALNGTLFKKLRAVRHSKFEAFRSNLSLSGFCDKETIRCAGTEYDSFITGSDQVFNYNLTGGDMNYLLAFADEGKRNAYAPSFGVGEIDSAHTESYRRLLSSFRRLSAREETGRDIIRELTGRDCPVVLDPVFLISREDWSGLAAAPDAGRYVLVFQLGGDSELMRLADEYAASKGLSVVVMTQSAKNLLKGFGGKRRFISDAGPSEFLGCISNAECVFTDSFHGTAFSICFGKPFYTYAAKGTRVSSRLENITRLLGLSERMISGAVLTDQAIDYASVNCRLNNLRNISLEYISDITGSPGSGA